MNTVIVDEDGFRKQFGLSRDQFYNLLKKGPPHLDIEGKRFFTLNDELIAWLNSVYKITPVVTAAQEGRDAERA